MGAASLQIALLWILDCDRGTCTGVAGERQEFTLRNVFKISNRNFSYKFQGYRKWSTMVKARRQQQRQAMREQQMSAEAASIKEALQRASSTSGDAQS